MILPALSCLIALGFNRPLLVTGTEASFWYCENDQSFGLTADGEESSKSGRRCDRTVKRAAETPMLLPRMSGVRREWLRIPGRRNDMAAMLMWCGV